MNKALVFVLGMVAGAVLTVLILIAIGASQTNSTTQGEKEETLGNTNYSAPSLSGKTYFREEGDVVSENSFKVIQVLASGDALANELEEKYDMQLPTNLVVLFENEDGQSYYDDQIIRLSRGKCVRQIGTFKYESKGGDYKTVPIVRVNEE